MAEQYDAMTEAYRFLFEYEGTFKFLVDVKAKALAGAALTENQVAAVLRCKAQDERRKPKHDAPVPPALSEGIYVRNDGSFVRVRLGRQSKKPYGELVEVLDNNSVQFVYAPGIVRELDASKRITKEQARAFALDFGRCVRCGALLTDEGSIDNTMGPVCYKKEFGS